MNTLELFPLEVYTFDYDGDTDDLLERAIMSTRKLGGTFNDTRIDVSQSSPDALKLFPEIEKFIYDSLSEIKDRVKLQCEGLKITTSWINRYRESAILPWHRHPMSAYSGAFFLNDRGGLTFKDPIIFRSNESIMPFMDIEKTYNIDTEPGKLVIFPWWVEHGASIREGNAERWTLSFNTMPYGSCNTKQYGYDSFLSSATLEIK